MKDLFSLLHFLRVETFGEWFWWNSYINQSVSSADCFDLLHQVLQPLILRRTKLSRDKDGKGILLLPSKNIHVERVKLNKHEKKLYDLLHSRSKAVFQQFESNSKAQRNYIHIFQIICKLRQFCVHPSLVFKDIDEKLIQNVNVLSERIENFLQKYSQLAKNSSQMETFDLMQQNKHDTATKKNKSTISDTYKEQLISQINQGQYNTCLICFEQIAVHCISSCGHVLCSICFNQSIKTRQTCPLCRHPLTHQDLFEIIIDKKVDEESEEERYDFNSPNKLTGSKVKRILEIIVDIHKKHEKVVVFTQWIGLINILEEHLHSKNIPFERIEGSVKLVEKERILRRFEKNNVNSNREDNVTVLLASIKSASVGLNLIAANHVILCDPWWNPAVEDQAMERVHRIGQTKEVHIWRIICEGTIEEKVIELHDKKREMISNALACSDNQRKEGAFSDLHFLLN